jgi:hypothetical protein
MVRHPQDRRWLALATGPAEPPCGTPVRSQGGQLGGRVKVSPSLACSNGWLLASPLLVDKEAGKR